MAAWYVAAKLAGLTTVVCTERVMVWALDNPLFQLDLNYTPLLHTSCATIATLSQKTTCWLHGILFDACYDGCMRFISRNIPRLGCLKKFSSVHLFTRDLTGSDSRHVLG